MSSDRKAEAAMVPMHGYRGMRELSPGALGAVMNLPTICLLLLVLGIVLTWLFYVIVARLVLWRLSLDANDGRGRRLPD